MLRFNLNKNPDELLKFGFKKEEYKSPNGQIIRMVYKYKTHWMKARCVEISVIPNDDMTCNWSSVICFPRWGHTEFFIPNIFIQLIKEDLLIADPADNIDEIYHTLDEYMQKYGDAYRAGTLWDFSKEDVRNGAVERRTDVDYWIIDDRYYEVPKEV